MNLIPSSAPRDSGGGPLESLTAGHAAHDFPRAYHYFGPPPSGSGAWEFDPRVPGPEHPILLTVEKDPDRRRRLGWSVATSVAAHSVLALVAMVAPLRWNGIQVKPQSVAVSPTSVTPLIAPPALLERADRKAQSYPPVVGELTLEKLTAPVLPRLGGEQPAAKSAVRAFQLPGGAPAPAAFAPDPPRIEPPRIEISQNLPSAPALPAQVTGMPAPPPKPKIAFERPGSSAPEFTTGGLGVAAGSGRAAEFGKSTSSQSGNLSVGDSGEGESGIGGLLSPSRRTNPSSQLELLSDPRGVDFRPYLIRVLTAVRKSWLAVLPESARMGMQGRVVLQFAIRRDGSVPKLVIAVPSGSLPLDRAAVAGISASHPFPPLPEEFPGQEIRLQMVFSYNLPSR